MVLCKQSRFLRSECVCVIYRKNYCDRKTHSECTIVFALGRDVTQHICDRSFQRVRIVFMPVCQNQFVWHPQRSNGGGLELQPEIK